MWKSIYTHRKFPFRRVFFERTEARRICGNTNYDTSFRWFTSPSTNKSSGFIHLRREKIRFYIIRFRSDARVMIELFSIRRRIITGGDQKSWSSKNDYDLTKISFRNSLDPILMRSSTHFAKIQKFRTQFWEKVCSSKFSDFHDLPRIQIPVPQLKFNFGESTW